jgi:excisionase family DNA binding protein
MVDKYFTVDQIAGMIDMHPKTIQRYIRQGRLKAQKIGKGWRVTGHDLSTFVEGTGENRNQGTSPGLQEILGAAENKIKVSSVIDIPVKNSLEAVQVMNWITSTMNSRSSEYGYTSMNSQFIEPEHIIRIMLWGSPAFMEVIMSYLGEFRKE